jgi:hypothetical protein
MECEMKDSDQLSVIESSAQFYRILFNILHHAMRVFMDYKIHLLPIVSPQNISTQLRSTAFTLPQTIMPGVAFTEAQTKILTSAIEDYQQITGKDRVAERERLIADLAVQVSTADEQEDEEGMRKIRVVSSF